MRFLFRVAAFLLVFGLTASGKPAAPMAPSSQITGDQILQFLNETVDWYRHVSATDQIPVNSEEVLFRDAIHQNAHQALRLAFDFARAEASLLEGQQTPPTTAGSGRGQRLNRAAAAAAQRVAQIQTELDQLKQQIQSASATSRPALQGRRDELAAELNFANARLDAVQKLAGFTTDNGGSGGLLERIDELQGSLPELQATQPSTSSAKPSSNATASFSTESSGVLGLVTQLFTLSGRMSELKTLAEHSKGLTDATTRLRAPLRSDLTSAIHRGDALAATQPNGDSKTLDAQREELDALAARFKLLAGAGVPLSEQSVALEAVRSNLLQWHGTLGRSYGRTLRALLVRLAAIGITILVLLGISTLWRTATFRYVHDARRRIQFLALRRIVVGCVMVVVIIAGVVTEFGSLATFAGLITAGIAVALQSVILSGAAYFFFAGRYGVRVGDRVTIAGITGDVIETGLFRLYLMELGGTGRDVSPTGRIVVFSNSVLFQPTPFYKQLPGADYVWHEVALTLAPESDYRLAEKRLLDAVTSVYNTYRDTIVRQHESARHTLHIPLPNPEPVGRLRFVDAGLEFVVRYPVDIREASEIDDEITRQLLQTINEEPKLRLVPSGTPTIQPAESH